ncbi:MAG: very short patch repair endonuclease [Pyrinomonadaceae bacterium]
MRAIRSVNTKMERALARSLWARGHRYRKNDKNVFGKPDLILKRHKLAIFVDSEFFHGKNWESTKFTIKSRRDFWWKKIEGNMKRDIVVNQQLKEIGWTVLRFWSQDVKQNLTDCIQTIETTIRESTRIRILTYERRTKTLDSRRINNCDGSLLSSPVWQAS